MPTSTCGVLLVKWRSICAVLLKDITAAVNIACAPVVAIKLHCLNLPFGWYVSAINLYKCVPLIRMISTGQCASNVH